jgi:hypothetical protein
MWTNLGRTSLPQQHHKQSDDLEKRVVEVIQHFFVFTSHMILFLRKSRNV